MNKIIGLIIFLIWGGVAFAENAKQKDSLLTLLNQEVDLIAKVDLYNQIAAVSIKEPKEVIKNAYSAINIANNINYEKGLNEAYLFLGIGFCDDANYDSALVYLNKSLIYFQQHLSIAKHLIRANNYLGIVYEYKTNYTKALYHYYESYKKARHFGDSVYMLKTINNIGLVHYAMNNYKEAEAFLLLGRKIAVNIKSELGLIEYNLGTLYLAQKKYDKALEKFKIVLYDDLKSENQKNIAETYNNIGSCYLGMNDLQQAELYINKGLDIRNSINDENGLRNSFVDLADLNIKYGHYSEALILLGKALTIAKRTNNKQGIVNIYAKYIDCFKASSDLKQALAYTELKADMLQEISNAESKIKLQDLESENLLNQKYAEIAVADSKIKADSIANKFWVAISIVLIIGFVFLSYSFLKIRNQNRLLRDSQKELGAKNNALHLQNEQILKSQRVVEQALKIKSDFTSTISHEIRTPLNAINGVSELLLSSPAFAEHAENLMLMKISSDKLIRLINDILDFSRLENGNSEFNMSEFDLNQLVMAIVELFTAKAESKGLDFILDFREGKSAYYKSDAQRISQVLSNMLSNSVKFTSQGFIKLVVYPLVEGDYKSTFRFEIVDSGVGIHPSKHHDIFEAFLQVDNSNTRKLDGLGLGLAICKKIVEAMGSKIELESTPNKGSRFYFDLELEVAAHKHADSTELAYENNVGLEQCRVLIVEDTIINVMILKQFLKKWDCSFDVADNGIKALQKVKNIRYDIVLMDIQMPEMDGIECTKIIRSMEDAYYQNLPIIAITAANESVLRNMAYKAGMNDYILKPFNPKELKQKMALALANNK